VVEAFIGSDNRDPLYQSCVLWIISAKLWIIFRRFAAWQLGDEQSEHAENIFLYD
jgi:hypothetical protein